MSTFPKTLYLLTASFPYGQGEVYMEKEVAFFQKAFDRIVILPRNCPEGPARELPENAEVNDLLLGEPASTSDVLKKYGPQMARVWAYEFRHTYQKGKMFRHARELNSILAQAVDLAERLDAFLPAREELDHAYFYSVWLDLGAITLAWLKAQGRIPSFVFRLHGYDLYDDQHRHGHIPFRFWCFRHAARVYSVCQDGVDYLKAKGLPAEKMKANYSGLFDQGENPYDPEALFTIVSCGALTERKRIDRLVEALNEVGGSLRWVHFGDGPMRDEIEKAAKALPQNVQVDLRGHRPSREVYAFYREESVSLFVHLSKAEGLPVAVMEPISFGIPVLATDVNGTRELLEGHEELLLPADPSPAKIREKIRMVQEWQDILPMRKALRRLYLEKFDAEKNYPLFTKDMMQVLDAAR